MFNNNSLFKLTPFQLIALNQKKDRIGHRTEYRNIIFYVGHKTGNSVLCQLIFEEVKAVESKKCFTGTYIIHFFQVIVSLVANKYKRFFMFLHCYLK